MVVSNTLETRGLGLAWVGVGSEVDLEAMKEGRRLDGRTKRREKGSRGELTSSSLSDEKKRVWLSFMSIYELTSAVSLQR